METMGIPRQSDQWVSVTYLNLIPHCSIYKQHWLHLLMICIHILSIDIIYHSKCSSGLPLRYIVLSSNCYQTNFSNIGSTDSAHFLPSQRLSQHGGCTWHCGDINHIVISINIFQFHFSNLKHLPQSIQKHLCILLAIIHSIRPYIVINFSLWSSSLFFLLAEIQVLDHPSSIMLMSWHQHFLKPQKIQNCLFLLPASIWQSISPFEYIDVRFPRFSACFKRLLTRCYATSHFISFQIIGQNF